MILHVRLRNQFRKSRVPPRVSRKMINGCTLSAIETLAVQYHEGIKEGVEALSTSLQGLDSFNLSMRLQKAV